MMSTAVVEKNTLEKLQVYLNDSGYTDLMQNSAKFNVRIRKDRVVRRPYIDGQTGIAQKHCNLFLSNKQRMPGILQGQVYTYPAKRWRSSNRSYLASMMQSTCIPEPEEHTITTVENPVAAVTNIMVPEDPVITDKPKNTSSQFQEPWQFYEENTYEEDMTDDFESEEDFDDETYNRKGSKRRRPPVRKVKTKPKKKPSRPPSKLIKNIKKDENDDKPYACELCGMRYKTRPGLTYHYSHSHKEEDDKDKKTIPQEVTPEPPAFMPPVQPAPIPMTPWQETPEFAAKDMGFRMRGRNSMPRPPMPNPPTDLRAAPSPAAPSMITEAPIIREENPHSKKGVSLSPYCDFCLGDAVVNKKTGGAEPLVSCADCGRSGHPSCLQFTDNMMKSVVKYRWQCIECKTCTLCGTSENDDQLLFCDDCDRGYHLYCLNPPLSEPPEGEWSCYLCIREFHHK